MDKAKIFTAQLDYHEAQLLIKIRKYEIDVKGLNKTIEESMEEIAEINKILDNIKKQ